MEPAWAASLASAIAALFAGIAALMTTRHKNRLEEKAQAFTENEKVVAHLQGELTLQRQQIERYQLAEAEKQAIIARLQHLRSVCREENAEARACNQILHDYCQRIRRALEKLGADIEPVPELPQLIRADEDDDAEFWARTTAHARQVMKGVDDKLVEPAAPPED